MEKNMTEISYLANVRKKRRLRKIKLYIIWSLPIVVLIYAIYWIQQRPGNKIVAPEDAASIAQLKDIPNINGYVRKATIAPKHLKRYDFEMAIFGAVEECQRIKKTEEIWSEAYNSEAFKVACSKALVLEERILKEYETEKSLQK